MQCDFMAGKTAVSARSWDSHNRSTQTTLPHYTTSQTKITSPPRITSCVRTAAAAQNPGNNVYYIARRLTYHNTRHMTLRAVRPRLSLPPPAPDTSP